MSRSVTLAVFVSVLAAGPVGAVPRSHDVPPPTPVPPYGSPSPYPSVLETPPPSADPPGIEAAAAVLVDLDSGRMLWERAPDTPRPIASLTKIMTALLVIERTRLTEPVTVSDAAAGQIGAELGLRPGEALPVRDLLTALLLQSANDAAVALAEHVSGTVERFVDEMNLRARQLRMRDTEFRSPSGLDDSGRSTAADLARLASVAFLDPTFAAVAGTRFATIPADQGEARRIQNRNALLWLYDGTIGGKTGYTAAAGFCLIAAAERDGLRLATVVLGAPQQAFDAAAEVLNHGFATWERETVVDLGEDVGTIVVDDAEVPVEADATLSVLAPRGSVLDTEVDPLPGVGLPVERGSGVATLVATVGDRIVGEAPLVAAETVEADRASPSPESFWDAVWQGITTLARRVYEVLTG